MIAWNVRYRAQHEREVGQLVADGVEVGRQDADDQLHQLRLGQLGAAFLEKSAADDHMSRLTVIADNPSARAAAPDSAIPGVEVVARGDLMDWPAWLLGSVPPARLGEMLGS